MTKDREYKNHAQLHNELMKLVDEINKDLTHQPANRRDDDFYRTKQVFLARRRTQNEHLRWYNRRRHKGMKSFLLNEYNYLNENNQLTSIDLIKDRQPDARIQYPDLDWLRTACHAAVTEIDELEENDHYKQYDQERDQRIGGQEGHGGPQLVPSGERLSIDQVAQIIAKAKGKPFATARSSLISQCSRKRMIIRQNNRPQALYTNQSPVPDIYIVHAPETGSGFIFQQMKLV